MSWRQHIDDPWQELAVAVACRVEFEQMCNRSALLDESAVVRFAAEFCQANWNGKIDVNSAHPNMDGKFVDLVGTSPQSPTLAMAAEAKWVREGGTREWLKEVAVDVFRLQHLATDVAQGAFRVIIVAGTRALLQSQILERRVHSNGTTVQALPLFLPVVPAADYTSIDIRHADPGLRPWLRKCHEKLGRHLPSTYRAQLAGRHLSQNSDNACEVLVWVTKRPQGWGSFSPTNEW